MRYGLTDEEGVFSDQNMKVTPTGAGVAPHGQNVGDCVVKRCPKNQDMCLDLIDRVKDIPHLSCIRRLVWCRR